MGGVDERAVDAVVGGDDVAPRRIGLLAHGAELLDGGAHGRRDPAAVAPGPQMGGLELERRAGVTGVRGTRSFLEVPTSWQHQVGIWRRRIQGPRPMFLCTTNNYALFASAGHKELLVNHLKATDSLTILPHSVVFAVQDAGEITALPLHLQHPRRALAVLRSGVSPAPASATRLAEHVVAAFHNLRKLIRSHEQAVVWDRVE